MIELLRALPAAEVAEAGGVAPGSRTYSVDSTSLLERLRDTVLDEVERLITTPEHKSLFSLDAQLFAELIQTAVTDSAAWTTFTELNLAAHPDFRWSDVRGGEAISTLDLDSLMRAGYTVFARTLIHNLADRAVRAMVAAPITGVQAARFEELVDDHIATSAGFGEVRVTVPDELGGTTWFRADLDDRFVHQVARSTSINAADIGLDDLGAVGGHFVVASRALGLVRAERYSTPGDAADRMAVITAAISAGPQTPVPPPVAATHVWEID